MGAIDADIQNGYLLYGRAACTWPKFQCEVCKSALRRPALSLALRSRSLPGEVHLTPRGQSGVRRGGRGQRRHVASCRELT